MTTHRSFARLVLPVLCTGLLGAAGAAAAQNTQGGAVDRGQRAGAARIRFQAMDTDHDGVITRAEWRGSDEAFRQQDANHDGVLSGVEVAAPLAGELRGRRRDELVAQFTRADRDANGRLTRGEWTASLGSFDQADANGDGMVTRAEYLAGHRTAAAKGATDNASGSTTTTALRRATPAYQSGFDKGLADGRQAGKEDRSVNGGKWDLEGQRELEQADAGYDASLGARVDYQAGYRAGFRRGYTEGFGPR
jgi:Ca2+-binding EF-hand superfamily protein